MRKIGMFSKLSKMTYCKSVIPLTFASVIKTYNCDFERFLSVTEREQSRRGNLFRPFVTETRLSIISSINGNNTPH